MAGENFLVGRDRYRADAAGQRSRRCSVVLESGIGEVHAGMLALLPVRRAAALCDQVTIDLDTTDIEVYGRAQARGGVQPQGQRCGRPKVTSLAKTPTVSAADLPGGVG
ncbi:MAG TPA: hypothetical protein VN748_19975 [Pseudonocardiaceae bacterium]|nr:hypothetical protein [Pseudonocardiaceae bacterium]